MTVTLTARTESPANAGRFYAIEFLRVFLIAVLVFFHVSLITPELFKNISQSLGMGKILFSNSDRLVEVFFVIGGFFLYGAIAGKEIPARQFVKNLYMRLAPAFITVFLACVLLGTTKLRYGFSALALFPGLSIPGQITGWGDWYVGIYFWVSIFLYCLTSNNGKVRFLPLAVLVYLAFCMTVNAEPTLGLDGAGYIPIDSSYFGVVGISIVRGIYAIGTGILFGLLCASVTFSRTCWWNRFYSVAELALAICLVFMVVYPTKMDIIAVVLVSGMVCVSFVKGLGVLSRYLNRKAGIMKLSRYCYAVFMAQIVAINLAGKSWMSGMNDVQTVLVVIAVSLLFGIAIYHFVEQPAYRWFKRQSGANY